MEVSLLILALDGSPRTTEEDPGMKWNNLGAHRHLLGQYREAADCYRKALEIWGQSAPASRANTLLNLVTLERQQGNYAQSNAYLREARLLESSARMEIAAVHLLREQGQPERARRLAEQIRLRKDLVPADRASAAEAIAQTYRDERQYELAAQFWQDAASIWIDEPNSERRLATALNNLAELSSAKQKYECAENYARQALEITERALGPHHRHTAIARNNLAQAMRLRGTTTERGVTERAEELYLQAIADLRALGQDSAADVGRFLGNLANFYHALGRETRAVGAYRDAIAELTGARGVTVTEIAIHTASLADVRASQGRFVEALKLYADSLPTLESAWGSADERLKKVRIRYTQVKRLADHYRVAVD